MHRRLALPAVALLALAAACGGNNDDVEGSEEPVVTGEVDRAVEIARLSLPATLADDVVADLIEDLCSAAGTGEVESVVAQLRGAGVEGPEIAPAVDALAAGAGTYCPDDVAEVVPQVQQALAPAATTTLPGASAAGGTTGSPSRSASSSSGSSGGGASTGGGSTSSSGSASVGGGNATGTGNSSSTDFTQGATSSNSSSSGGSSNSTTTG